MATEKAKKLCGICKVGEKGQIVIPKEFRTLFNISAGDSLVILGDIKKGIALVKADVLTGIADEMVGDD